MVKLNAQLAKITVRVCFLVMILPFMVSITGGQVQASKDQKLNNLVAFTRLLGYVRYFHPADTVADTDWDAFAIAHIETIEAARTRSELVTLLNELFTPHAPTVQVFQTHEQPDPVIQEVPENINPLSVTQWVHIPTRDLTNPDIGIIPSTRHFERVIDGRLPQSTTVRYNTETINAVMHNPLEPLIVQLGEGVSASIPLALFADSEGTLPHIASPSLRPVEDSNYRAAYLATVAIVWNHFQHLFSYWDVLDSMGVDWDAALREAFIATRSPGIDDDSFIYVLRRMTAYLRDGHSYIMPHPACRYLPPAMFDMVEGELVVGHLLEPDDAPDISSGDVVLEWDGHEIHELLEAGLSVTGVPTEQFGLYRYIFMDMMCGESQEPITLKLHSSSTAAPFTTTIQRSLNTGEYPTVLREPRPPVLAWLDNGIAYIDLTRIDEASYQNAIPVLASAEGIVIDVRGYPNPYVGNSFFGHLTDKPLSSAPFLTPVVTTPDHVSIDYFDVSYDFISAIEPRFTDNIAFITNGNGTASYGESLMGIVEGYTLAPIVGQPTAGTNGNVAILDLPGDIQLYWTSLHVTKFDGSPLYTVGITPTIAVERTLTGVVAGRDELLEAAFEYVGGDTLTIQEIALPD